MNGEMHGERVYPQNTGIHYTIDTLREAGETDRDFVEHILQDAVSGVTAQPHMLGRVLRLASEVDVRFPS